MWGKIILFKGPYNSNKYLVSGKNRYLFELYEFLNTSQNKFWPCIKLFQLEERKGFFSINCYFTVAIAINFIRCVIKNSYKEEISKMSLVHAVFVVLLIIRTLSIYQKTSTHCTLPSICINSKYINKRNNKLQRPHRQRNHLTYMWRLKKNIM